MTNLSDYLYQDEAENVNTLLETLSWDEDRAKRVEGKAIELVERVRSAKRKVGELESFLQQFGLQSEEGLALMTLAEALLRIPDSHTADLLIKDKMVAADWLSKQGAGGGDILTKAAGFGLSMTKKTLEGAMSRLGAPVIRKAMVEAMRMMGRQFVLGRTIEEGIKNADAYKKKGYRMSYDMLGEGARTMEDAERYYDVYHHAITEIGKTVNGSGAPGISVQLSALHPRYEYAQKERCVPALTEKLNALAELAAEQNIAFTVDAEEVDRLELSLDIIENVYKNQKLNGWDGFGLAVQAYQKRSYALINHLAALSENVKRRLCVRLVKGAYWDTEVKRAQIMGLDDYPVYTRKVNTDVSYLTCAQKLMAARDYIYPMYATHNAQTVAAIMELAGNDRNGFEFQRLHGMGETLHDQILKEGVADISVYAPCGSHEDLLPYLVRRLLENGANSSFVYQILDHNTPPDVIAADPVKDARLHDHKRHTKIPMPEDIYGEDRKNSAGMDLTDNDTVTDLIENMSHSVDNKNLSASLLIKGQINNSGKVEKINNPAIKDQNIGSVCYATDSDIDQTFRAAKTGFESWSAVPAEQRAKALETLADLMEKNTDELMGLCVREAGKTIEDALGEIREAVDFCRYYAVQGRKEFDENGQAMPGPTGEINVLTLHGRGTFVCISPWNFPLAIFTGQIVAALMAGNAVISKPAEQTPLVAMRMAELIHQAGVPVDAFHLLPGNGDVGAKIIEHTGVAGVAFTGSTEVARIINRALAAKDGPIVPLIAETGGQNAMIVDSSALAEQVIDDVLISAFGSAGQRCSALRVLYVQDDVADKIIHMLKGAMAEMKIGDPMNISTDVGPVIDEDALSILEAHKTKLDQIGTKIAEAPLDQDIKTQGHFFAPVAYEIKSIDQLEREVFGPVLHVVRFKADNINAVLKQINDTGYGLTCGVHSRITSSVHNVTKALKVGNAYVNRTTIGAVVGVQPFGGQGLSGTGPKAGGPHYLHRFATEKVVSVDTTRQGGNASLVTLEE